MPFWSRNKGSKQPDPAKYMKRAQKRLQDVQKEMDLLDRYFAMGTLDREFVAKRAANLRRLAEEQLNEVVPHPTMEEHKNGYFQIIDMQARKVEDIVATDGENLEALLAEEEELERQAADYAMQAWDRRQRQDDALGYPRSDSRRR